MVPLFVFISRNQFKFKPHPLTAKPQVTPRTILHFNVAVVPLLPLLSPLEWPNKRSPGHAERFVDYFQFVFSQQGGGGRIRKTIASNALGQVADSINARPSFRNRYEERTLESSFVGELKMAPRILVNALEEDEEGKQPIYIINNLVLLLGVVVSIWTCPSSSSQPVSRPLVTGTDGFKVSCIWGM